MGDSRIGRVWRTLRVRRLWPSAAARRIGLRAVALLAIGVLFSAAGFQIARTLERQRIDREFENAVADRIAAVQRQIDAHHHLLVTVAALWNSSDYVSRRDFRAFVEALPLHDYMRDLQAISWAPAIPGEQREQFEAEARASGTSGFRITERNPRGEIVPAAPRPVHFPVAYIEPLDGNEAALGYDLGSNSDRLAALRRARDTGEVHTTKRLRLVQDTAGQPAGFLSALPVYRQGAAMATVADRRRSLLGFATQVFRIRDVVEGGLSALRPGGIDLHILDPLEEPGRRLIYQHASRTGGATKSMPLESELRRLPSPFLDARLSVGDRDWRVVAAAAPGFLTFHQGPLPWFVLGGGLGFTVLMATYLAATMRRSLQVSLANDALSAEVAERRRSEQALRQSEDRLRRVVEGMPVLMVAFDEHLNILAWNGECERITGYGSEEIVGNSRAMELLYPDQNYRERMLWQWKMRITDNRKWEWELTTKQGETRTVMWSNISRTFPLPGWNSWGIGIDITEHKRIEAEREQMNRKLLQAQKLESLGVLVGGIAHDFNNLLTAILGNVSLALEGSSNPSSVRECLEGAVMASERAALLTEQLLIYAGKSELEKRSIDLSAHVQEISRLLANAVSHKVGIRLDLATDLPAIEADLGQLQQLIMNLVINAAEACEGKDAEIHIRTSLAELGPEAGGEFVGGSEPALGRYVVLEVRDTGVGMAAELQARIFDPFYTTKFTGRGLGLAAALGIVRSHRGGLQVSSAPGRGSSFQVLLPVSDRVADRKKPRPLQTSRGRGVVLAVDDEPMILTLVRRLLEEQGYQVLTAESGQNAVEIFRQRSEEISCVLLDVVMPGMGGPETYRALRGIRSDVVTLFSSGYSETEMPEGALREDGTGFMRKPFNPQELVYKVGEALAFRFETHA